MQAVAAKAMLDVDCCAIFFGRTGNLTGVQADFSGIGEPNLFLDETIRHVQRLFKTGVSNARARAREAVL